MKSQGIGARGVGVHWFVAWRYLLARPRRLSVAIVSFIAFNFLIVIGFYGGMLMQPLADPIISPYQPVPWWLLVSVSVSVASAALWPVVVGLRYVLFGPATELRHWLRILGLMAFVSWIAISLVFMLRQLDGLASLLKPPSEVFALSSLPGMWLLAAFVAGATARRPRSASVPLLLTIIVAGLSATSLLVLFRYFHRPFGELPALELASWQIGGGLILIGQLQVSVPLLYVWLRRRQQRRAGGVLPRVSFATVLALLLTAINIVVLMMLLLGLLYYLTGVNFHDFESVASSRGKRWLIGLAIALGGALVSWLLSGEDTSARRAIAARIGLGLGALALCSIAVSGMLELFELAMKNLPEGYTVSPAKQPLWLGITPTVASSLLIMSLLLLAIRYFATFFSTVSIGGVAIGSMALVIVLSVMSGFENDLRRKILGSNAHVLVTKATDRALLCRALPSLAWHRCVLDVEHGLTSYRELGERIARASGVEAQSPYLISEVVIAANNNYANVIIKGIDPDTVGDVGELDENVKLEDGTVDRDALARLWPLAEDGSIVGRPKEAGERATPRPKDPDTSGVDPAPGDFGAPDEVEPFDFGEPSGSDAGGSGFSDQLPADPTPADFSGGAEPDDGDADDGDADDGDADDGDADDDPRRPLADGIDFSDPTRNIFGGNPRRLEMIDPDLSPDLSPDDFDADFPDALDPLRNEMLRRIPPMVAILPGTLVGKELVKQINLYDGQEVKVVSPLGQDTPLGPVPRTKRFRVGGTFFTGMYEYDLKFIYVEIGALQDFLDLGDEVTGIEIRVSDPTNTGDVVAGLRELLGPEYRVQDWKELNRSLFSALKLEKIAMFLVLAIIILVASFSIVGNLIMVVVEKAREIAVLKTLGTSDGGVMKIFVTQGFFIGLVGTLVGVSLGLTACLAMQTFGLPLDPDVYYIDKLPIHIEPLSVILVFAAGIIISVIATLYPAYIAASMRPVNGLRYE